MNADFEIFNSLVNPVAICSSDGEILFVNDAWREYGNSRGGGDNIGENYLDHCVGSNVSEVIRQKLQLVLNGYEESFVLEYPCHGPLESDWFEVQCSSYERAGERFVVIEHVNISEQKVLENEVNRLNSFLTSHTGYMNHEIKNKATIISGHADVIKDTIASKFPSVIDKHILPILNAVDEIVTIMDNNDSESPLFASSNPREIDVNYAICQSVSNISTGTTEIIVDVSGEFLADEAQLKHLVENLVLNALEHSRVDDVDIKISDIESDDCNGFYIEDSGSGFPINEDTGEFSESDFGTGLDIVQRVVENHNWSIEFENTDKGGKVIISGLEPLEETE